MNKILITICVLTTVLFAKTQKDYYLEYWNNPQISSIIVELEYPQDLDKLSEIDNDTARFEMGRLCFSLGLYRQAEAYFLACEKSEIRDIYITQVKLILNDKESAKEYLSSISGDFFGMKPILMQKIEETGSIDKSSYFHRYSELKSENKKTIDSNSIEKSSLDLSSGNFTLQFGAFSDKARAENLAKKIQALGLKSQVIEKLVDNKNLFIVLGGKYDSYEQAEKNAATIEGNYIYKIVKID